MSSRTIAHAGLVLLLGLASCTSGDREDGSAGDSRADRKRDTETGASTGDFEVVRGRYRFAHETRELRPCGQDATLWVIDRSGLLGQLHGELIPGKVPDAEVFAMVIGRVGPPPAEGFGTEHAGTLTVADVLYVAGEGFGCEFDWSRFLFRAMGNEPFWMAEVLPAGVRLTRPGEPDLTWTDVEWSQIDGAVVLRATGEEGFPIELVIEPGHSRDTMSGAFYGLSARLVLDGKALNGHALQGTLSEAPVDDREGR